MKKILITFLFLPLFGKSQAHVVTVGGGFAFPLCELNRSNAVGLFRLFTEGLQFGGYDPAGSIGYRYYMEKYFSFGAEVTHLQLSADDKNNVGRFDHPDGISNFNRNLNFKTKINHFAVSVQYEPWRDENFWSEYNNGWHYSPYIGIGLGLFTFNPTTVLNGKEYELQPLGTEGQGMPGYDSKYSRVAISIPVTTGIKITLPNRKFAFDVSLTVCQTSTDYIDDVGAFYASPADFSKHYGQGSVNYQLADRSIGQGNPAGSPRGINTQNDYIVTGQLKLIMFVNFSDGRNNCFRRSEWQ